MAVISGARSLDAIEATVLRGMLPLLKVCALPLIPFASHMPLQILWVTSPGATFFAQKFLPTEVRDLCHYLSHHLTRPKLWVPFFNIVSLAIGVRALSSMQYSN
jgi:hypothetical protein